MHQCQNQYVDSAYLSSICLPSLTVHSLWHEARMQSPNPKLLVHVCVVHKLLGFDLIQVGMSPSMTVCLALSPQVFWVQVLFVAILEQVLAVVVPVLSVLVGIQSLTVPLLLVLVSVLSIPIALSNCVNRTLEKQTFALFLH